MDMSCSQGGSQQIEPQALERMLAEVVHLFLISEQKKLPVKKQDITKLTGIKGNSAKSFKALITSATKYFEEVFGYTIQEFDDKSGYFILVNTIPRPDGFLEDMTDERMLLFVILGAIYLSGGSIGEEELWNMLDMLGYGEDVTKKLVTNDFVKQLYLDTEPVPMSEPVKVTISWGLRAESEFTKLQILDFASQIYGAPAETFGALYTKATSQDQNAE